MPMREHDLRTIGAMREITAEMRATWAEADRRARRRRNVFRIVFALVAIGVCLAVLG